jgi:glycosyltransferase involved in cell wall biosynthesis
LLTVLMATRNGASTLPAVLDAYCRLAAPAGGWRLLIVDNGSTDGSDALIDSYCYRLPLQCLNEPRRGKNFALNHALETALRQPGTDEDLFIFTDDDATPAPDWLQQWKACGAGHPDYGVFGGAIVPDWAEPPPAWVTRLVPLGLTYGLTAPALSDGPIFPGLVWGANMAIRRAAFVAGHRFNTSVGPNGGAYAMGSETELTRRLAPAGYRSWFCSAARVAHHIRVHQLQQDYVLEKAWRFGRGKFRQDQRGAYPEWLGVQRWAFKHYAMQCVGLARAMLARDVDSVFQRRWELAYQRGYFHEAWHGQRGAAKNVLVTSYSGELGGMELRMAQEVRYLQAAGYGGSLAMRRFDGVDAWALRLAGEQISVAEFDPPLFFEQWPWRRWNLWRARWLMPRRLLAFKADLVHIALCWTHYGASVLWLAQHCRLPAVVSVHNAFPPTQINTWHEPLLRQAFRTVRGIYAVSESALAHFLAIYRPYIAASTRLAVIPNCVDIQRFRPSAELRGAARERLNLPPNALVIGAVARLSVQKRPDKAIELFVLLRTRFPALYLVLAGSGPLEPALREQVERLGLAHRVIFAGFVANVEEVLPALDLHILMSRNEGFGIATIEAMACGIPAVATDVPGSADILRDSQGGLLVPANDLAIAAQAVAALLADPARRATMGQQARAEVEQRYSVAVVGKLVHAFYDGLV